jgi:single-strand DNA-binding protein
MKTGINKVTLMGNIVRDLELRYTINKKAFLQFTVACNFSKKTDGVYESVADFIPCVAWGKLAETIAKYFQKGSPIYLEGKVKVRSYEKDGAKKYVTEILADLIRFIGETRKDVEPHTEPGDEVGISPEEESDELLDIQFN